MNSIFYVMAILGCGDGDAACTEARLVETRYVSQADCQANMPAMLARNTDLSYPVISATCRRNAPLIARAETMRPQG